jgi:hypothetical protein
MIPICPLCKKTSETIVSGVAQGVISRVFSDDGQSIYDNYDKLFFKMSQVVRCAACGKIRRNLICTGFEVKIN